MTSSTSASSVIDRRRTVTAFFNAVSEIAEVPMNCIHAIRIDGSGEAEITVIVRDSEGFPIVDLEAKEFEMTTKVVKLQWFRHLLEGWKP